MRFRAHQLLEALTRIPAIAMIATALLVGGASAVNAMGIPPVDPDGYPTSPSPTPIPSPYDPDAPPYLPPGGPGGL